MTKALAALVKKVDIEKMDEVLKALVDKVDTIKKVTEDNTESIKDNSDAIKNLEVHCFEFIRSFYLIFESWSTKFLFTFVIC